MTVNSTTALSGPYTPDGVATAFPFTFNALTEGEVEVYTTLGTVNSILTTGYTVSLTNGSAGGVVRFSSPPAIGSGLIYIASNPSFTQDINLSNQGPFLPEVINEGFDRAALRDIILRNAATRSLKLPLGDNPGDLPNASARAGGFIAFDAEGNVIIARGQGSEDPGLRADLAANSGASLVGFLQAGTGAVTRSAQSKNRDVLSALDYGSVQQGLNFAGASLGAFRGDTLYLPQDGYSPTSSLQMINYSGMVGVSRTGSVLDNQNITLAAPQIVNSDPASFVGATLENMTSLGGTHFLKLNVSSEVSDVVIQKIRTALQTTAQIEASSLQTTIIRDCNFDGGVNGLKVTGYPCNSVTLDNCRITGHSGAGVYLRGFSSFKYANGSMEGGGVAGQNTIDISDGGVFGFGASFTGVFFENTHEYVLKTRNTALVSIADCHFTGTNYSGSLTAYKFDCLTDRIEFGSNYWAQATTAPQKVFLRGQNANLLLGASDVWTVDSNATGRIKLKVRTGTGTTLSSDLLNFARPSASAATSNIGGVFGKLRLNLDGVTGGNSRSLAAEYSVRVNGVNNFPMSINTSLLTGSQIDSSGAAFSFTLTATNLTTTGATLHLAVAGLQGGVEAVLSASFEWDAHAYTPGNEILVTAA